jgi:hypothetical protein
MSARTNEELRRKQREIKTIENRLLICHPRMSLAGIQSEPLLDSR